MGVQSEGNRNLLWVIFEYMERDVFISGVYYYIFSTSIESLEVCSSYIGSLISL